MPWLDTNYWEPFTSTFLHRCILAIKREECKINEKEANKKDELRKVKQMAIPCNLNDRKGSMKNRHLIILTHILFSALNSSLISHCNPLLGILKLMFLLWMAFVNATISNHMQWFQPRSDLEHKENSHNQVMKLVKKFHVFYSLYNAVPLSSLRVEKSCLSN